MPVQTDEGASRCVCAESGDISAVAALLWNPEPSAGEGPSTIVKSVCAAGALLLLLKSHNGWTPAARGRLSRRTPAVRSKILSKLNYTTSNTNPDKTIHPQTIRHVHATQYSRKYNKKNVYLYHKNNNNAPAARSKLFLSKFIFASCVRYSDRAYYLVCVL